MQPNSPLRGWGTALAGLTIGLPVFLYRLIRGEIWALGNLPIHHRARHSGESKELHDLQARLAPYAEQADKMRQELCRRVVQGAFSPLPANQPLSPIAQASLPLVAKLIAFEGHFSVPALDLDRSLPTSEVWELSATLKRRLAPFEKPEIATRIEETLERLLHNLLFETPPSPTDSEEAALFVPLHSLLPEPTMAVEGVLGTILGEQRRDTLFPRLWQQLERNLLTASGIDPTSESHKEPIPPTKASDKTPARIVADYLSGTPFADFFETPIPFSIPLSARFEHTHVLGGSGHGKTQFLQSLILRDIERLAQGRGSVVVIDSQGDMIRSILGLAEFSPTSEAGLAERLVLIDPNDVEHPPCLNLFDFGLERLTRYDAVEREKLINGAIALYEYIFGALLGADLTQRQEVIFRYLARLLMVVPGATIHTLREFMEEPETTRMHLDKLDPMTRHFFERQFFSKAYDDTRQQILTRLWGVLSNTVLARMFAHPRNALDLFDALNRGSLILVNTAKDLLKQEGCEILGRFFIAMIVHAAQERASIPADRRRPTFVYVDEAQDYFDQGIEQLLNQARKYKVGLILAHQNLSQLESRLEAAVMASTAIKLAGGVSAQDATALAKEMCCEAEFLQGMRKRHNHTEFACFIRNLTPRPLRLAVPFGQMENRPRLTEEEHWQLLARNRARFCESIDRLPIPAGVTARRTTGSFEISEQEVL